MHKNFLKDCRDFLHNSIKKSIKRGMNIHDNEDPGSWPLVGM